MKDSKPSLKSVIRAKILNWYTGAELYLAALTKDPDRFGGDKGWMKENSTRLYAIKLKDWQTAIAIATDPEEPDRNPLYTMYERCMYDDIVIAATEQRISRVKQSKFRFVAKDGKKENEDLTKAFKKMWFYEWIKLAMETRFWGHSLVGVTQVDETGEIKAVELVNRRHVKPLEGIVVREEGDDKGLPFRDGQYANWNFEFGSHKQLGILAAVVPFVAIKSMNTGAWSIYNEKFGMPIRTATTPSNDKKRLDQLAAMMRDMGTDLWAVLQGDEKIEMVSPSQGGEGSKTYDSFWTRLDSAISRMILGNDGTTSNKDATGTYGSVKAMTELQEYRHWDDKTWIAHLVNDNKDKFAMFGYDLNNWTFEWDEFEEMPVKDLIDAIPKIATHAELDWKAIAEKTGIPILGPKVTAEPNPDPLAKK
jgi:hypothetical protein